MRLESRGKQKTVPLPSPRGVEEKREVYQLGGKRKGHNVTNRKNFLDTYRRAWSREYRKKPSRCQALCANLRSLEDQGRRHKRDDTPNRRDAQSGVTQGEKRGRTDILQKKKQNRT